eukprot:14305615-Alexandrium_andersonii.AAC.1
MLPNRRCLQETNCASACCDLSSTLNPLVAHERTLWDMTFHFAEAEAWRTLAPGMGGTLARHSLHGKSLPGLPSPLCEG